MGVTGVNFGIFGKIPFIFYFKGLVVDISRREWSYTSKGFMVHDYLQYGFLIYGYASQHPPSELLCLLYATEWHHFIHNWLRLVLQP